MEGNYAVLRLSLRGINELFLLYDDSLTLYFEINITMANKNNAKFSRTFDANENEREIPSA